MPDFTVLLSYVRELFVNLFPIITSAEWTNKKGWTDEQRAELNKLMHSLNDVFNGSKDIDGLRPTYDRTIWEGHKSGKVSKTLEPVRKETVRKDGETNTVKPTAAELFDKTFASANVEATPEA